MPTLNAGLGAIRKDTMSTEDRALIEEFLRTKKVEQLQPVGLEGNEASLATRDRVAQARRDFRKAQRNKNK